MTTRTFNAQTGWVSTIQAGTSAAVANFGYTFDLVGNLNQRVDSDLSRTDNFTYDPLNRLSTYSIAGAAYQTMGYDALGDISSKPGIGTYNYPAAGQPRPHAVSSITGTVRGVTNPTFVYDADGNTLLGPGMAAAYTSFDMPATIGNNQGASLWDSFNWGAASWASTAQTLAYNSEHQRMEMSGPTEATFYFNDPVSGAVAEFYVPATGATQWRDYVMADGGMTAERTAVTGGATTWQYFTSDHLGSIAVVADASGNVLQRMLYDPWGLQLNTSGGQLCNSAPTTRGYTGQEQMPIDCLVNLNARVYDPIIGRFLAGDGVISSVYDQQALNRYSYVHDNPLSYTDPNGDCGPFCIFVINVVADLIFAEALKPVFERVPILGDLWIIVDSINCGPLCAAEDAGVLAGVKSGDPGKAIEAFALTYAEAKAFDEVGDLKGDFAQGTFGFKITGDALTATSFVLHGLVGGSFSVLQGGQFGSGFLSAGVSDLASPYILASSKGNPAVGAIEAGVLGGTASVIGGGKFENGAITGAFGYLYNDYAHSWGAAGAAGGAVAGAVAVSGACDVATDGACALATPATVAAGSIEGTAIGGAAGMAAGTVADEVVVTAQRVNANSSSSMQGTELYYLINRDSGKIDKIGVTSYPGQRYPQSYLDAENVRYETQYYFQWRYAAYLAENIELTSYFATHLSFPRLNCCAR